MLTEKIVMLRLRRENILKTQSYNKEFLLLNICVWTGGSDVLNINCAILIVQQVH